MILVAKAVPRFRNRSAHESESCRVVKYTKVSRMHYDADGSCGVGFARQTNSPVLSLSIVFLCKRRDLKGTSSSSPNSDWPESLKSPVSLYMPGHAWLHIPLLCQALTDVWLPFTGVLPGRGVGWGMGWLGAAYGGWTKAHKAYSVPPHTGSPPPITEAGFVFSLLSLLSPAPSPRAAPIYRCGGLSMVSAQ